MHHHRAEGGPPRRKDERRDNRRSRAASVVIAPSVAVGAILLLTVLLSPPMAVVVEAAFSRGGAPNPSQRSRAAARHRPSGRHRRLRPARGVASGRMRRSQAGEEEGGDEGGGEGDDDGDFGAGATASSSSNDARVVVVTRRESLAACRRAVAIIAGPVAAAPGSVIRDPAVAFVAANDAAASAAAAAAAAMTVPSLRVPLRHRPALSACTVSYVIGNSNFGAILDTGSPFLMVPAPPGDGTCRPNYEWGCLRPSDIRPTTTTTTGAGLRPTTERFDGNEGRVDWREGRFSFLPPMDADTTEERTRAQTALFPRSSSMAFGIASESLMDGPGGVFLGLAKHADRRIRPSFLGQSDVSAFSFDLRVDGDGGGGGGSGRQGGGGEGAHAVRIGSVRPRRRRRAGGGRLRRGEDSARRRREDAAPYAECHPAGARPAQEVR